MTTLFFAYILFLVGFSAFSWAGLYHLWRFGYVGDLTRPVMIIYVVISLAVIVLTLGSLAIRLSIGG